MRPKVRNKNSYNTESVLFVISVWYMCNIYQMDFNTSNPETLLRPVLVGERETDEGGGGWGGGTKGEDEEAEPRGREGEKDAEGALRDKPPLFLCFYSHVE